MKKVLSIILSLALMLGCVSVVSFAGFEDAVQVFLGDNAVAAPAEGEDEMVLYFYYFEGYNFVYSS